MRVRAILLAWVLLAQVVAPSLALASTVRSCCCAGDHGAKKCHCPSCSKARAFEEGQQALRSCGSTQGVSAPHAILAVEAPSMLLALDPPATDPEIPSPFASPPSLALEVPTPPPLH